MSTAHSSLDSILADLGDFGKYQSYVFGLVCVAVILHSAVHIAYVFSAKDLEYRCKIPECENGTNLSYNPSWLENAVPFESTTTPAKCSRYAPYENQTTSNNCSTSDFNTQQTLSCDSYVYSTEEVTILQDFNLHCDDNLWKLTLVGTINNIGQFVGLPLSGIISDRYGRRLVLVMGMVLCGVAGVARSFVTSYVWFLILEFTDAMFGAGTYACGFILGVELVGPEKRVLSGTLISSCYAVGEVLVAGVMWMVKSWRSMLQLIYLPTFFLLSYFWITPESIRWNLTKGRIREAQDILRKAASVNGKTISEHALEKLGIDDTTETEKRDPLIKVFKSTPLLLRFVNCCFCWITCTFLFYGLTLNSVSLAGNSYLDFILTSLVEVPAYFACYFVVDRIGRRASQAGSFILTGVACIGFIFVPQSSAWGQLCVYLAGKFGATAAFTVVYIMTSEIFPTPLRHSLMGTCSMFGRFGSMVSPQTPLLAQIWTPLPLVSFAAMAITAGLLSLLFPETLHTKLPDTIEEAENIGKKMDEKDRIS